MLHELIIESLKESWREIVVDIVCCAVIVGLVVGCMFLMAGGIDAVMQGRGF